ncbi:MAG: UDP-glucose 4-epimerase GalE [Planctomycetales bacterium]|nr:UDP-glucose 4-epimerase GalE [Planctomycetales bacterium]NIM08702.1 UDP-glucose 4-epimerase GalE [Planctomycetales bacterium]NIN08172.1 UDP-glucose 4-epimerase GalE [Planctomycetales bacterium]NIN77299.1 UDP-glucose 4-epimerase GalE [Planctomycetales bacterium]NIO34487.1 UDP-glucose 4-epimerase GalE [Planctomycetales bacterium]
MPDTILVTGGAGYIGSVAVERLIEAGYDVVVLDNLSMGHRAAVHPAATFVEGDLADRQAIESLFDAHPVQAIMHFASKTLVGESMQQPFLYLGDNVVNGVNLLSVAVQRGVRKFILSSTANLFDQPSRIPIDENEAIVPGSPYGESKYILERILSWLDRTCGLRYAALRYFNAAGATEQRGEDHDPETHLIPLVLQVAQGKRDKITVFGDDYPTPDGTCVRDYIHIADLADAHILALQSLDKGSCTFNLGNGAGFSVRQVIQTASEVSGCEIPFQVGPRRAGDPPELVASSDAITRQLGWQPNYPTLRQIVQTAWDWHQAHPEGYGDRSSDC